jgi:phytoene synthase
MPVRVPLSASDAHLDAVRNAARSYAPDLYAAALLAPREARSDLVTLAAYLGEVRRIPLVVRDVTLALIRLQWWRDALAASAPGAATGHPVADAVIEVIRRRGILMDLAIAPLDASEAEMATDPLHEAAFAGYLDDAGGAPFRLAARVLGITETPETALFLDAAGRAAAATQLAVALPFHLRCGRLPASAPYLADLEDFRNSEAATREAASAVTAQLTKLAGDELALARQRSGSMPPAILAATLPAALVPDYLNAVKRPGRDVLREVAEISPLRRMSRLWLVHWRGTV